MTILWWHWLVLGLLLVLAELAAAGGFYIIFFGIAALIIGVLDGFGVAGPLWFQLLSFSVLAVAMLAVFRSRLLKLFQADPQAPQVDALVGEIGTAEEYLEPGRVGRVELRGTAWSARNTTAEALHRGTRIRVVRVEGLMLLVEPEGAQS
jgi:inner membrane protein